MQKELEKREKFEKLEDNNNVSGLEKFSVDKSKEN
jgi:hypothetical protein